MPMMSGASLSFEGSGTDFCRSSRSSACESSVWRRSWGGDSRLDTRGCSVEAKGDMASMAKGVIGVEPRGFEPLTSAVQSQSTIIVDVRRCSKMPANKHILP